MKILIVSAMLAMLAPAFADNIKVATFNTESETSSGDTQPVKVAETFSQISGKDVWGLHEVEDEAATELYM